MSLHSGKKDKRRPSRTAEAPAFSAASRGRPRRTMCVRLRRHEFFREIERRARPKTMPGVLPGLKPRPTREAYAAAGSRNSTDVPLSFSLVTAIVPPFNSTLRLAIVSPSPVPVALVEK